jgi:hypothetical protein
MDLEKGLAAARLPHYKHIWSLLTLIRSLLTLYMDFEKGLAAARLPH